MPRLPRPPLGSRVNFCSFCSHTYRHDDGMPINWANVVTCKRVLTVCPSHLHFTLGDIVSAEPVEPYVYIPPKLSDLAHIEKGGGGNTIDHEYVREHCLD